MAIHTSVASTELKFRAAASDAAALDLKLRAERAAATAAAHAAAVDSDARFPEEAIAALPELLNQEDPEGTEKRSSCLLSARVPPLNWTMSDEHFCSASSKRLNYRCRARDRGAGLRYGLGNFCCWGLFRQLGKTLCSPRQGYLKVQSQSCRGASCG